MRCGRPASAKQVSDLNGRRDTRSSGGRVLSSVLAPDEPLPLVPDASQFEFVLTRVLLSCIGSGWAIDQILKADLFGGAMAPIANRLDLPSSVSWRNERLLKLTACPASVPATGRRPSFPSSAQMQCATFASSL